MPRIDDNVPDGWDRMTERCGRCGRPSHPAEECDCVRCGECGAGMPPERRTCGGGRCDLCGPQGTDPWLRSPSAAA